MSLRSGIRRILSGARSTSRPEYFYTNQNPRYAGLEIGDWTYGNPILRTRKNAGNLKIGKFCSIAANVTIFLGGEHRTDWITTYPFSEVFPKFGHIEGHPHTKGDVIIGNDVWLASNVIILSGVTIGDGAVIGAGSVVTKNVDPYLIVAGNPAKPIRYRFSPEHINALLEIAWWNWTQADIEDAMPLLLSGNVETFLTKHKPSTRS